MNDFVAQIKKNGAIGVLAMWLWYTHNEVQELKSKLYECYGKQLSYIETKTNEHNYYAVIPEDYINKKIKRIIG
jgi:hypothetical protein